MLGRRPSSTEPARSGPVLPSAPRWPFVFLGVGGVIGAAGVAVGAAGAHLGGGDLSRTASEFLMIHAVLLVAASGVALAMGRTSAPFAVALGLIAVGAVLFGGELSAAALLDWRPVPLAAPAGGLCLIAGWLTLAAASVRLGLVRR